MLECEFDTHIVINENEDMGIQEELVSDDYNSPRILRVKKNMCDNFDY